VAPSAITSSSACCRPDDDGVHVVITVIVEPASSSHATPLTPARPTPTAVLRTCVPPDDQREDNLSSIAQ